MKKLMTTTSQAISRMTIWMKLSKKLTKPIKLAGGLQDRLARIDADLRQPARLKRAERPTERDAAATSPRPAKELKMTVAQDC